MASSTSNSATITNTIDIVSAILKESKESKARRDTDTNKTIIIIQKQVDLLKKLCRPRLVPINVKEILGSANPLLDSPYLYPTVLAVKKCNTTCSYCGEGIDQHGDYRKVCTASATRFKNFKIQGSVNNTIHYEKVTLEVDRTCECRSVSDDTTSPILPKQ
ncbi:hypothetical protein Pcinc_015878 [Petrolisthes cinctipes]|uniref:Platelet-derived growth factor (PDGF) family profile domain-containing protein n=1 Tax=Petrolisthes cinctipes TaxID=88211 RepID=A0AAE1FUR2_PETCI|nr:hypothetical protein Pcinc_015878 [Petrolisthes cinctipes]